ncbi:hypothetical protein BH24CHL1_BH24CHL1_03230 [soil metagenome]
MRYALSTAIIVAMMMALTPATALAEPQECEVFDQSTDAVLAGVTMTWDSSFLCENAPAEGEFTFVVSVTNDGTSAEAVTLDAFNLRHTTPRPCGAGPDASAAADGLPFTLAPGETGEFVVTGAYELVTTDEGAKANLHFRASGFGNVSGDRFNLGINVHIRAEGAVEESSSNSANEAGGPPPWAGGPPPWAGGHR